MITCLCGCGDGTPYVKEETFKQAEAEILRLREGLRRIKELTDNDMIEEFINKLLNIEDAKEF